MLLEEAIYKLLKNSAEVTGVVAGRIFAGVAPQEIHATPYVVYRSTGDLRPVQVLDNGCTLVRQTVRVYSAGATYGNASVADAAVIKTLDEFEGTVTKDEASPEESIDIQCVFLGSPAHEHQYVDRTKLHEFVSDFECYYIDPARITES